MFGKSARILELEQRLHSSEVMRTLLQAKYDEAPRLISVRREGRALVMIFERDGERFTFETYSTISSDVKGLLKWANIA